MATGAGRLLDDDVEDGDELSLEAASDDSLSPLLCSDESKDELLSELLADALTESLLPLAAEAVDSFDAALDAGAEEISEDAVDDAPSEDSELLDALARRNSSPKTLSPPSP